MCVCVGGGGGGGEVGRIRKGMEIWGEKKRTEFEGLLSTSPVAVPGAQAKPILHAPALTHPSVIAVSTL